MLFGDTESNGFKYESTRVWVICTYNPEEDRYNYSFDYKEAERIGISELASWVPDRSTLFTTHTDHLKHIAEQGICMHNYFQHDRPLLRKFVPTFSPAVEFDTYIQSQLFNPDRAKHSLEFWGEKLGNTKPKYDDWYSGLDQGMVIRVTEDTKITYLTYKYLTEVEGGGFDWSEALKTEMGFASLIGEQEMYGVHLDQEKAYTLAYWLYAQIQEIDNRLSVMMPKRVIRGATVTNPYTLSGHLSKRAESWFKGVPVDISGQFSKVEFEDTNLNSPEQLKSFLLTQGWKPTSYTEKGSPQLTEDSYQSIKGGIGKDIAARAVFKHRANMIFNVKKDGTLSGFLNNVRGDGRIEASAITNATNTGRVAHRNLVNVPKPNDGYIYELRELFDVDGEDRVMVGIDADSLEAKVTAHFVMPYKGGVEFATEILEGDIHSINADRWGVERGVAKGGYFCLLYGGQVDTFSSTICVKRTQAKKYFDDFWRLNTALNELKNALNSAWRRNGGYIRGLDGRKIHIRSQHSIMNALIQCSGSIIVKKASVIASEDFKSAGLDAHQVIHYHDEFEVDAALADVDAVKEIMKNSFTKASQTFKLRVEITGTPETGKNWKEVH